jgi:Fic family protein
LAGANFELPAVVAGVVSEAEHAVLRLSRSSDPALGPMARLLLRTESIASSKVEVLQVNARQLARAESRLGTGAKVGTTVLEVLANIGAMGHVVESTVAEARIQPEHIAAIHRALMTAGHPQIGGVIRTGQNWIGGNDDNPCGADFVPPPPEEVPGLLEDLCAFMQEETLPPLVQAALAHVPFETIHPFGDGNGRTGRALIHVVLRRRGIVSTYVPPISVILAARRERYIEGLTRFRAGEISVWIELFAEATARSARLGAAYLEAVAELLLTWQRMLGAAAAPRADAAAWAVIGVLPAHPVINAPIAQAATGRAKAAIHGAMKQLVDCGVLVPVSKSKRNQSFEAAGLLELLEGLEVGRSPASA